jgi:predicted DsbA family dithiol-disulfide isomerase
VVVSVAGSPSIGEKDAKVSIVEFTDFQCPFCSAYVHDTFGQLTKEYGDTGKVRYTIRNFPLEQSRPLARKAAEAPSVRTGSRSIGPSTTASLQIKRSQGSATFQSMRRHWRRSGRIAGMCANGQVF